MHACHVWCLTLSQNQIKLQNIYYFCHFNLYDTIDFTLITKNNTFYNKGNEVYVSLSKEIFFLVYNWLYESVLTIDFFFFSYFIFLSAHRVMDRI